jgi:hypothetical protein
MKLRPVSALVVSLSLFVAAAASSGACGAQGEGMVCDVAAGNAGSDDCQNGLTCQPAPGAFGTANPYRCCPTDLTTATASVCMLSTSLGDASTAVPTEDGQAAEAGDAATDGASSDGASTDGASGSDAADGAATDGASSGAAADASDGAATVVEASTDGAATDATGE